MEARYFVTRKGFDAGWMCMHNGGFCKNPPDGSRYLPLGSYTPATFEELELAVEIGELRKEYGHRQHIGGILYNWVPCK